MASAGPNFPTTVVDDSSVGGRSWSNLTRVGVEDGSEATSAGAGITDTSHYLKSTGFGFAIPAGATILGIQVDIKARNDATGTAAVADNSIKLVKGGVIGGTDKSTGTNLTGSLAYRTYGSSIDLWGQTWTVADINATTFGIAASWAVHQSQVGVDAVRITVYYSAPATVSESSVSSVAASAGLAGTRTVTEASASAGVAVGNIAGTRTVAEASTSAAVASGGISAYRTTSETSISAMNPTASLGVMRTVTETSTSDVAATSIGPRAIEVISLSAMVASATQMAFRVIAELSLSDLSAFGAQTGFITAEISTSTLSVAGNTSASRTITETSLSTDAVQVSGVIRHASVSETSLSDLVMRLFRVTAITEVSLSNLSLGGGSATTGFQVRVREKAPLRLTVGTLTPAGVRARWADDDVNPRNVPGGLSFSTTMPGGFEQMSCVLTRNPGLSYPDLQELSTLTIYGAGKTVAGQYRLEQLPDQSGDQMAVNPGAVGWQAHLDDNNSARMVGVDQDVTQWQGPSIQRQIQWMQAGSPVVANGPTVGPDFTTGFPSLIEELSGSWTENQIVEAWYDAHGLNLGRLIGSWETNGAMQLTGGNAFGAAMFLVTDDTGTSYDQLNPITASPGAGSVAATQARKWGLLQFWNDTVPGGKDGVNFDLYWTALAVYGDHGLPLYTPAGGGMQGLHASDLAAWIINKWCPKLGYTTQGAGATIQPSSFVIPHYVFLDPVKASDMIKEAAKYELLDWAVWEGPTFYLNPRGARGRKWLARTGEAKLQQAGPQVDRLWNGVVVQWTDVTGVNRTIGPLDAGTNYTDATLRDLDSLNPLNEAGIRKYALVTMGTSTQAGALAIGRLFLQEQKLLSTAGQATLTGHVQDSNGIYWPAYMIRAGDYISFTDSSDTSPRRIVHTSYDDTSKASQVQLDQPPDSLAAILERLSVSLSPYGMS